ncbi:MAG: hypothetical protein SOT15_10885 [Treponema sp.]|nr:hypothetical protein [Treponema sp.]
MNGWYDDFDDLYDLYDNDEPTLYLKEANYMYCFQHCWTEENPRNIHITATDLSKVPDGADYYDKKYEVEVRDIENSFKLFHKYVLANGKTIAQMMCDANGWDYSILPVYPKWYSPLLGEIKDTDDDGK